MTRHLVTLIAAACTTSALAAQGRPDFSGRWTSDPDPATAAAAGQRGAGRGQASGDMGSGWGSTITVTQDNLRLTVEYAFFTRGDMQPPLKFVYALDGSETKNTVVMGRGMQTQTSRTAWNGEKLAITTVHTFIDPASGKPATTQVTQTLSLESPTVLIVEATRAGVTGGQPTTSRTSYRKLTG
jgi:hypothetical protein